MSPSPGGHAKPIEAPAATVRSRWAATRASGAWSDGRIPLRALFGSIRGDLRPKARDNKHRDAQRAAVSAFPIFGDLPRPQTPRAGGAEPPAMILLTLVRLGNRRKPALSNKMRQISQERDSPEIGFP